MSRFSGKSDTLLLVVSNGDFKSVEPSLKGEVSQLNYMYRVFMIIAGRCKLALLS